MKFKFFIAISLMLFICNTDVVAQTIPKWKIADLKQYIDKTDKPTVINFWATFCKPCVEEIPYFQQLIKKYDSAGIVLRLVSLDLPEAYPQKISAFAAKQKFTAPIIYLDETNADLFCPVVDPKWSGAIPASLFINPKTGYRKFFEEQLTQEEFEKQLKNLLAQ